MVTDRLDIPGAQGVYTPKRVGALAGVSGQTIGQWARAGLLVPTVYRGLPTNLYSFQDAAEAIVIRWLLDEHHSTEQIKLMLDRQREEHPFWPLQSGDVGLARYALGESGIIARRTPDGYADGNDQLVAPPLLWDRAADVLRHGGWLARDLNLERIEVDPVKLGGRPTLRDRRWTVRQVAVLADDEEGRAILRDSYGLLDDEIREALTWEEAAAALR